MAVSRIAVIGGDGIGPEVIDQAIRVADAALRHDDAAVEWNQLPWSGAYYQQTGHIMPADGWDVLRRHDAILLGAIGHPDVPDHITLHGLLLPMRRQLRPVRQPAAGLPVRRRASRPLRDKAPGSIDMLVYRENTEGEYAPVGGRLYQGTPHEVAIQTNVFTRRGCERIMRAAFEGARKRPRKKVTSITKSNAQQFGMVLWDEVFEAVAKDYPDVQTQTIAGGRGRDGLRAQAGGVRRGGGEQPVRRHPDRPERDHHRQHGPGGQRQHQSGAGVSEHVRAGPRLGPGHRRQGHRQPAGGDPVGGDAAGSSGICEERERGAPTRWRRC